ncbi:MAG: hypothetical protein ACOYM0_13870 [Bacteroidales bacterium]
MIPRPLSNLRCTMYDVRCTMYDVRCTIYNLRRYLRFSEYVKEC